MPASSEHLTVNTPESAAFVLEPAGLGSRFVATLVDMLIQGALVLLLLLSAAWVTGGPMNIDALEDAVTGLHMLALGIVLGLYHLIFESVWQGRSPGKRVAGLRVVKTSGVPISFWDACLRNLLRIIDYLPVGYFIGTVTILTSRVPRRIGDYAAGTVVVRDRRLDHTSVPHMPQLPEQAAAVGYRDQELIAAFLARRMTLEPQARTALARQLADRLHAAGLSPAQLGLPEYTSDEDFLLAWHSLQTP